MAKFTAAALLSALCAVANASNLTLVNAQVGKMVTLTWTLPEGVWPYLLTLQHGNGDESPNTCLGCEAITYETLVRKWHYSSRLALWTLG